MVSWMSVRGGGFAFLLLAGCASGGTDPAPSAAQPSGRWLAAMVYDAARQRVLLFGGRGAQASGELWSWDGRQWTLRASNGPAPRDGAVLAYDPATQHVLLWGGRAADGTTRLSDTWVWNDTSWTLSNATGVGAYEHAAGSFDETRGRFVVYTSSAGQGGPGAQETWESDGSQPWTSRATTGAANFTVPLASALVWEPTRPAVLGLFGDAAGAAATQLWQWNGTAWSLVGAGPAIDPGGPLVRTGGNVLLTFAGEGSGAGHTWAWSGGVWSQVANAGPSGPRFGSAMAYDAGRHRVVLFGGFTGSGYLDDTWEFDGVQWTELTP